MPPVASGSAWTPCLLRFKRWPVGIMPGYDKIRTTRRFASNRSATDATAVFALVFTTEHSGSLFRRASSGSGSAATQSMTALWANKPQQQAGSARS